MVDRTRLKEALDAYTVIDRKSDVPAPPQELTLRVAVRAVVEAPEIWWCENHETGPCAPHDAEIAHCFTGHAMNGEDTCRMVRVFLVPAEDES